MFAQWIQTSVPSYGGVCSLAVFGTKLFAGNYAGGVFCSTDNGTSWTDLSIPIDVTNAEVRAFAFSSTNLFTGLSGDVMDGYGSGVYRSTNGGTTWTAIDSGLTNLHISALAFSDTSLIAGTDHWGAFLSTDYGTSWSAINVGLSGTGVRALAVSGGKIFAGTDSGVFLTTNNGTNWKAINAGLMNSSVLSLALSGTSLFAATNDAVYVTTNNGTVWNRVTAGLAGIRYVLASDVPSTFGIRCVVVGTQNAGTFLSTDGGAHWISSNADLGDTNISVFGSSDSFLFAGTANGHLWFRRWQSFLTAVVESPERAVPLQFTLDPNYPNPFNPRTTIAFALPTSGFVSLKIFNWLGQEVAMLVSEELRAGHYKAEWDASGFESGVYYCLMECGGFTQVKKLILFQ